MVEINCQILFNEFKRKGKLIMVVSDKLPAEIIELFDDMDLNEDRLGILMDAVNDLPERDVRLLMMRYWKKLSWREIGDSLGIDENSASGRHNKILNKLKKGYELRVMLEQTNIIIRR